MFNGGAGEAMEFYASIFKDARVLNTILGPGGSTMGGTLEIEGQLLNTFNGGSNFKFAEGMSLLVNAATQGEIDHLYNSLSDGGEKQPCGWLKDKFGVSWQIIPPVLMTLLQDPDRQKAERVMQAMLKMHKISIRDLEAAADAL